MIMKKMKFIIAIRPIVIPLVIADNIFYKQLKS